MRTKLFILPIIFFILSSFTLANFYIDSEAVKKDIFLSEAAEFDITITNVLNSADVYTFSTQDPSWILLTQQLEVPANNQKKFSFKIDPGASVPIGVHAVNIKVKSANTGAFKQHLLIVNIRPYDPVFGEYRPSIQFSATVEKEIDPRKKLPVEIYMRNRNALDIGELEIVIDGEIFSDSLSTTLGPMEEKRTEYLFEIDPIEEPGLYSLDVQVKSKNITISRATKSFEIIGYSDTNTETVEKKFLFKKEETITIENTGNAEKEKQVNLIVPSLKRLFTTSIPDATKTKTEGKKSLEWIVSVPAQSTASIIVTTNYRIPIGIIIAIIIIIFLYYKLRSPLIINKEVLIPDILDDGVEQLKIRLFVKNRSGKNVEKTTVIDKIPGIAEFISKKVLGTIHPDKITKQDKKGTLIKWNLDTLEPFEERIITYEIKSKLKIIGNISLPSARVVFLDRNKERRAYSPRVIVTN